MLDIASSPKHICILRLSAIGDICHTLPIIRTIQNHSPNTKITWIIGKVEYELLKGIEDIEFMPFDKKNGFKEYLNLRNKLSEIKFDVLLHMQMSLRSSLINLSLKSDIKIGFDKKRAKDLQWLFTNKKIAAKTQQHVMDSLFGFSEALGIKEHEHIWNIPISSDDEYSTKALLIGINKYIIISPCSSKAYRNWNINGYVSIANYINKNTDYKVVLTGGRSSLEIDFGNKISQLCDFTPLNLINKTNLKELLSIISHAKCMIGPDSGPAHMSTAMMTPVIGLYATTNPDRARPYSSAEWVVNRYPDAIQRKYNKAVNEVPWGTRVRDDWAMNLITVDDVILKLNNFLTEIDK